MCIMHHRQFGEHDPGRLGIETLEQRTALGRRSVALGLAYRALRLRPPC